MRGGKLRHFVTIQQPSDVDDEGGGVARTWITFTQTWAEILPMAGEERFRSQQIEPFITHEIKIRGNIAVTSSMRVLFDSRAFNIHSILDSAERGISKVLGCEELAA